MAPKKYINLLLKWLGLVILVIGLGFIVRYFIQNQEIAKDQVFDELPSGEEVVVKLKSDDVKVYDNDKEISVDSTISHPENFNDDLPASINHIFIPRMGVDAKILQGGIEQLAKGVWLLPKTSTPDKGGNTVISAHRWKFKPPDRRTFYNIDKLQVNDIITIWWNGKKYIYRVSKINIVTPDHTEILYPTKKAQLTLFSCTPLYQTTHRLVVVADLINTE